MMLIQLQLSTVSPVPSLPQSPLKPSPHTAPRQSYHRTFQQNSTPKANSSTDLSQQHQLLKSIRNSKFRNALQNNSIDQVLKQQHDAPGPLRSTGSKYNSNHNQPNHNRVNVHRQQQKPYNNPNATLPQFIPHPYLHHPYQYHYHQSDGNTLPSPQLSRHTETSSSTTRRSSGSVSTSDLPPRVCCHSLSDSELDPLSISRSLGGRMRGIGGVSLDTKALVEASRNLTQTLRQLSSDVLTNKSVSTTTHFSSTQQLPHSKHTRKQNSEQRKSSSHTSLKNKPVVNAQSSNSLYDHTKPLVQPSSQFLSPNSKQLIEPPLNNSSSVKIPINSSNPIKKPVASESKRQSLDIAKGSSGPKSVSNSLSVNRQLQQIASNTILQHAVPQGAIIESMQHHGKGVFSGTFSGTFS